MCPLCARVLWPVRVYKQGPVFCGGGAAVQVLSRAAARAVREEGRGHGAAPLRTGAVGRQRRTCWLLPREEEIHVQRW